MTAAESHGTFEDYCRERWGYSRQNALRQIEAAKVADTLAERLSDSNGNGSPKVLTTVNTFTPPRSEGAARELAPLRSEPDRMREAWEQATEKGCRVGRRGVG